MSSSLKCLYRSKLSPPHQKLKLEKHLWNYSYSLSCFRYTIFEHQFPHQYLLPSPTILHPHWLPFIILLLWEALFKLNFAHIVVYSTTANKVSYMAIYHLLASPPPPCWTLSFINHRCWPLCSISLPQQVICFPLNIHSHVPCFHCIWKLIVPSRERLFCVGIFPSD